MANSISAPRVASATLAANAVDLVFLTQGGSGVAVTNVSGSAPIWFTVDAPGGACKPPTVGASVGAFCSSSVAGQTINARMDAQFGAIVQLISTGTPQYTVALLGKEANM